MKIPIKHKQDDLTYESDEPESVDEINDALVTISHLSLQDFLANEPDIYTLDDLIIRY